MTNNTGLPIMMKETIVPKQDRINVKGFRFMVPYSILNVENSGYYKMKYKVVVSDYESSLQIMSSDFRNLNFLYIADNDKYIDLRDVWWESENMLDRKGILLHAALCAYNMNNEEITIRTTILFGKDEKDTDIKKLVWKGKLIIKNGDGSEAHEYANLQSLIPMTEIFKIGKYSSISTFYTEILDNNGRILAKRGNSSIEDAKGKPYIDLRNVCVEDNIVKEEGFEGMMIHSNTYFYNMKGAKIQFCASFFQKDKLTPLKNARGEAVTMNWGYVIPEVFFHGYDMKTFIPYFVIDNSDIEKESIEEGEKYTFHIRYMIKDENGQPLTDEKVITINTKSH